MVDRHDKHSGSYFFGTDASNNCVLGTKFRTCGRSGLLVVAVSDSLHRNIIARTVSSTATASTTDHPGDPYINRSNTVPWKNAPVVMLTAPSNRTYRRKLVLCYSHLATGSHCYEICRLPLLKFSGCRRGGRALSSELFWAEVGAWSLTERILERRVTM